MHSLFPRLCHRIVYAPEAIRQSATWWLLTIECKPHPDQPLTYPEPSNIINQSIHLYEWHIINFHDLWRKFRPQNFQENLKISILIRLAYHLMNFDVPQCTLQIIKYNLIWMHVGHGRVYGTI